MAAAGYLDFLHGPEYAIEQGRDCITLCDSAPEVIQCYLLPYSIGQRGQKATEIEEERKLTLSSDGDMAKLLCRRENV